MKIMAVIVIKNWFERSKIWVSAINPYCTIDARVDNKKKNGKEKVCAFSGKYEF